MPSKGAPARAKSISLLAGLVHERFLDIDRDKLLSTLATALSAGKLSGDDAAIVRETWRSFSRARKLPEPFVRELAELTATTQNVWETAKAKNDFAMFAPHLARLVEKKREEARRIGFVGSPYNALLDE